VHFFLFIDQTGIQSPLKFCSPNKTDSPSREELEKLSLLDLDAPSIEAITSQTDASSSMDFDLNFTTEEYKEIMKKRTG